MIVLRSGNTIPQLWIALAVSVFAAVAFYFSTNAILHDLDYTADIASALLRGDLGLREKPPEWLNEMIPHGDRYYSAFPLGAVLSMIPIALLQKARLIHNFPAHVLASLIAGCCVYFFFQLAKAFGANYSSLEPSSFGRRILLALFPVFGTWTWCNLGFGGAWQIALGLALLGQTAALYFTLVRPSPLVAGTFFALAYGNRTELLITAPLYLYFFWQRSDRTSALWSRSMIKQELGKNGRMAIRFLSVPVCLAILTAAYNFARFHSIFDFGYTHIPEVHEEPWYEHGLFSIQAVPWNIYTMLFQGFASLSYFPYIEPNGFGCSIFLASPFLCLLFREGGKYKIAAWVAIAVLTLVLWCHGNPGSWQFSYRYAMILLPWMFLLLTGNGPPRLTMIEISLFTVSVAINALAMWLFLWTDQIQGE
ncbi:MAG: hypothetical protein DME80_11375 [Verrucomicrobia bacterium]|nr:MAG: hypothetical protein DMF01_00210 [Verrucomicrobiota bacterium]PYJ28806.1 MAG: hypothetical protein DME89_05350 [Verrucomicrobiota bacterium]PYJ42523.1 MAG: hypothetical protein DME80_11375 [Verrucomicrobiota bacterium]PYL54742.1 MAG: hypothetical protein DMF33_00315 [Verrucomicrobiota bacterium]